MATIRLAACSDLLSSDAFARWNEVERFFSTQGETVEPADGGTELWDDSDWWLTADPTGGSRCLESLPALISNLPAGSATRAQYRAWWSLSDNTLVLNALLDRGLCRLLHGQPLTLSARDADAQRRRYLAWRQAIVTGLPFPIEALPPLVPLRGRWPESVTLIGGNLSALERLGTTPWRPRPRQRFLLVEGLSPTPEQAISRLASLVDDPWWEDIAGLVLGRFTLADKDAPGWVSDCLSLLPPDLAVARLPLVGHGADAWTIPLGEPLTFPLAEWE